MSVRPRMRVPVQIEANPPGQAVPNFDHSFYEFERTLRNCACADEQLLKTLLQALFAHISGSQKALRNELESLWKTIRTVSWAVKLTRPGRLLAAFSRLFACLLDPANAEAARKIMPVADDEGPARDEETSRTHFLPVEEMKRELVEPALYAIGSQLAFPEDIKPEPLDPVDTNQESDDTVDRPCSSTVFSHLPCGALKSETTYFHNMPLTSALPHCDSLATGCSAVLASDRGEDSVPETSPSVPTLLQISGQCEQSEAVQNDIRANTIHFCSYEGCGQRFDKIRDCALHELNAHGAVAQVYVRRIHQAIRTRLKRRCQCFVCCVYFDDVFCFGRHFAIAHREIKLNIFTFSNCSASFATTRALEQHWQENWMTCDGPVRIMDRLVHGMVTLGVVRKRIRITRLKGSEAHPSAVLGDSGVAVRTVSNRVSK